MKIAITTSSFGQFDETPLEMLRSMGVEYVLNPHGRAITEDEAIELLKGCVGVAAGTEPLTARVMAALPELKVISRCGVGMDSVDLEAAKQRGIDVRSTPDAPTRAVVELTLGYALDLLRGLNRMDAELKAGVWKKRMGSLIFGKRVGIIGYGRIGRAVGQAFAGLGCDVAFYDPFVTQADCPKMEMEALLAWADIITLHCNKPKDGSRVLDAARIGVMKPGSWLLNAARGGLADEQALYEALKEGRLAGAALDVFEQEPYTGPLKDLPTVLLTPHIGSYAKEARIGMEIETIKNLLDALNA